MITAGCTTERSYRTFLNVVPVKVRAGNKTVTAYAFLDQGSTATLCESRAKTNVETNRSFLCREVKQRQS